VDQEDQGVLMIGIKCERCSRTFADERALLIHYEHGLKSNMVQGHEDAHARFPERAECAATDDALRGKGLVNHQWESVTGPRDAFWTAGPE
jgi:hypothetical protein